VNWGRAQATNVRMRALDHIRLDFKCPNCDLYLFGTKETPSEDGVVFCSECRAGGSYEQIVEKRSRLLARFVSRNFVEEFFRQIRVPERYAPL
jgi:hypothetical protein